MITDDPIRDLERQLVAAATTRAATGHPANRSGRRTAILAAAAVGLLVTAAVVLTGGGGSVTSATGPGGRPAGSIVQAAYSWLDPTGTVIHMQFDTRSYAGRPPVVHEVGQTDVWYSGDTERDVSTKVSPINDRAVAHLETVSRPGSLRYYESNTNTLTTERVCRPRGTPAAADPVAEFRALYHEGRITRGATSMFDGRRVRRLVARGRGTQRFVYLVGPRTGAPVAMIDEAGGDRSTVRFTGYQRLPVNVITRRDLRLQPHPGARPIHIGGPGCTG
jgi:hypothetical protein